MAKLVRQFAPLLTLGLLLLPQAVQALTFDELVTRFRNLVLGPLVALLIGLGVTLFLWGLVKYIRAEGQAGEQKEEARRLMVWGVIAIFVMVSVWGLVTILIRTLGLEPTEPRPPIPQFQPTYPWDVGGDY